MHEQVESAVRDRVAANIAQGEDNAPFPLTSQRTMSMNMKNVKVWRPNGTLRRLNGTHQGRTATSHRSRRADHRGQAVLRRRHPDRRQLSFRHLPWISG